MRKEKDREERKCTVFSIRMIQVESTATTRDKEREKMAYQVVSPQQKEQARQKKKRDANITWRQSKRERRAQQQLLQRSLKLLQQRRREKCCVWYLLRLLPSFFNARTAPTVAKERAKP